MKTIAFIPARGGSKSIPRKNIRPLGGRPLLHWSMQAAEDCPDIDRVYVSSDSAQILECARSFPGNKTEAVVRPAKLATDTATTESALLHFAQETEFDRVVLLQATSPLTTAADIGGALKTMDALHADSLLSVTHEHRFRWRLDGAFVRAENYDPQLRPRRQDWGGELIENGAFYVSGRSGLLATGCRLNGKVAHWVMPGRTAVEIDRPEDWEILESFVRTGQA